MRYAIEYTGYLTSQIAAVEEQIDKLDLTETCEHWWSSGPCDPIVSVGQAPRYHVEEQDVPSWVVAGVARGQDDGRWEGFDPRLAALEIVLGEHSYRCDWCKAVRILAVRTKHGKFERNLIEYFAGHGVLTPGQASAIINPPYRRNR